MPAPTGPSGLRLSQSEKVSRVSLVRTQGWLRQILVALTFFYLGLLLGSTQAANNIDNNKTTTTSTVTKVVLKNCPPCPCNDNATKIPIPTTTTNAANTTTNNAKTSFPSSSQQFLVDYATIPRDDFNELVQIGVPMDDTVTGAEDVVVFYTSRTSLPSTHPQQPLSAQQALENCATVKVVLQEPSAEIDEEVPSDDGQDGDQDGDQDDDEVVLAKHQTECLALVPQWESYHVHKFMRRSPKEGSNVDMTLPLQYVSRSHDTAGHVPKTPDPLKHTNDYYQTLVDYLQQLDATLEELRPILKKMQQHSSNPKSNTVIVQVCNRGQAPLFHNFVCNAGAKNLDLSHIILFATDEYTLQLGQSLGITTYYNEKLFGGLPQDAAVYYGDRTFAKMMMAKIYCVHLVLNLGYNVLFQDVEIIWYQNPLPYFQSKAAQGWDMMFQDDGSRSRRYAPYSPNSGFYFVKHSTDTLYFFSMLLRSGDLIRRTASHQEAMTILLNEQVSARGLRVKVLRQGETNPFPGGIEYNFYPDVMKSIVHGNATVSPYIFHMSWTQNKEYKRFFLEQLGEWYLEGTCDSIENSETTKNSETTCCLAEPEIVCHFRDKPSRIPCTNYPPMEEGHASFW